MLTLSTKVRYSTRVLIDIALLSGGQPVPLHRISGRQRVSVKYLEALMPALKSSGLLGSTKGPHGGYFLARPADRITLLDVVSAFGGPVSLVGCVQEDSYCDWKGRCAVNEAWERISTAINSQLREVKISDLARRQKQLLKEGGEIIFHI